MSTEDSSYSLTKQKCREWQPIDKDVLILRLAPLMPSGYAWRVRVVKGKARIARAEAEWIANGNSPEDFDHPLMHPTTDQFARAQESLARRYVYKLTHQGWLVEGVDGLLRVSVTAARIVR